MRMNRKEKYMAKKVPIDSSGNMMNETTDVNLANKPDLHVTLQNALDRIEKKYDQDVFGDTIISTLTLKDEHGHVTEIENVETITSPNGTEIMSGKWYDIFNKGKKDEKFVTNLDCAFFIENARKALYNSDNSKLEACVYISKIVPFCKELGYNSIGEFCEAFLDIGRVTAGQYARIGTLFLNDAGGEKLSQKFSISQYLEFLTYVAVETMDSDLNAIQNLIDNKIIDSSTSTKKIRQILKSVKEEKYALPDDLSYETMPKLGDGEKTLKKKKKKKDEIKDHIPLLKNDNPFNDIEVERTEEDSEESTETDEKTKEKRTAKIVDGIILDLESVLKSFDFLSKNGYILDMENIQDRVNELMKLSEVL